MNNYETRNLHLNEGNNRYYCFRERILTILVFLLAQVSFFLLQASVFEVVL